MYVEHFYSIQIHLPSIKVRSRNSCENNEIFTENVTALLTYQIPYQPQYRLNGTCTISTGKIFIFVEILVEKRCL
jgi:hypothetical protein